MKKFSRSFLIFVCMLVFVLGVNTLTAQSINPNGGFEDATLGVKAPSDVTGWWFGLDAPAAATYEIIGDDVMEGSRALKVEITTLGANAWNIQAVNDPFTVVPNAEYTYSIWVKADIEGPIVNFTVGDPSYKEWGRAPQVVITTEWQEVTFEFAAPAGATTGRAPIHFSESANSAYMPIIFYIDDLRINTKIVGIEKENQISTKYELGQNYPNPFNPVTTISFKLPVRSDFRLELVNILGQVVKEIASGNYEAGIHQVKLDASDMATGIYFYRLEAGGFVDVKKLVLLK